MNGWGTLPLASRVVNLDKRRVPVRSADRRAGPYPYYGASGIVDYIDNFIFEGLHLLVAEDGENLRSRKTPIAFLADGQFWVNNHAHILQGNEKNDTRFLGYALEATDLTGYLSGSTQPKLTQRSLASIPITAPELREQQEIAQTLGALDDKIASNRRAVELGAALLDATIEIQGQSLPVVPLGDLAVPNRLTAEPASLGDVLVDHFSLPAFDDGGWPDRVPAESIMSNKIVVGEPSVLVSRLNPRFNRTWWAVPADGIAALASTEFSCLSALPTLSLASLWLAVRDRSFRDELPRRVTGTSGSHQRIRPDDLLSIEVPDTRGVADDVEQDARALLDLIHLRRREMASLRAVRDVLVPELLSGRLRVPEARSAAEAVA